MSPVKYILVLAVLSVLSGTAEAATNTIIFKSNGPSQVVFRGDGNEEWPMEPGEGSYLAINDGTACAFFWTSGVFRVTMTQTGTAQHVISTNAGNHELTLTGDVHTFLRCDTLWRLKALNVSAMNIRSAGRNQFIMSGGYHATNNRPSSAGTTFVLDDGTAVSFEKDPQNASEYRARLIQQGPKYEATIRTNNQDLVKFKAAPGDRLRGFMRGDELYKVTP